MNKGKQREREGREHGQGFREGTQRDGTLPGGGYGPERSAGAEASRRQAPSTYRVGSGKDLSSRLFTDRNTFKELARACEGVVRNLINIFSLAFNNAFRRDRDNIDRRALLAAARQRSEQDKARYLDDQLQAVLRKIVDEVIGERRARPFLLPRHLERDPIIQKLFDARVLHQMQRGYADKDNPGVRYNIYTLDYGTFVDLTGTSKQPTLDLFEDEAEQDLELDFEPELVVPFDDKRSIRRIILDEGVLT